MYFWIVAAITFALDQITKLVAHHFLYGKEDVIIIPSFLKLHYATNKGAAFSLMSGQTKLLSLISLIAIGILLFWYFNTSKEEKWTRAALGLVFGGALGNMFDRFFRGDGVIDFILAHWKDKAYWPVFNTADSAICVGIFLLMLLTFIPEKKTASDNAIKAADTKFEKTTEIQPEGNTDSPGEDLK